MAGRYTARKAFSGESEEEMELEVEEWDNEDAQSTDSEENVVLEEDEDDLTSNNLFSDEHVTATCIEEEEEDIEIEADQEHPVSESSNNEENNEAEDIPSSLEGDFMNEWCENLSGFPMRPNFLAKPGLRDSLNLPPGEDCKPIDFFNLFINKDQIKKIKSQTNLFAKQVIDNFKKSKIDIPARSFLKTWKPVRVCELYDFFAIILHMSVLQKPRLTDYWTKRSFLQTTFAPKVMKRERFMSILKFLHLNDNSLAVPKGQPGFDPLHELRPFIDHLNHTFQTVYMPEQHISIDEALCPWKGRLGFKVYMKDKPTKWGIKLYELCESKSGYVWRFEVFCCMPGLSNRPYDVVQRLMEPLKSLGYCLYTDRYYTCPALAEDLACNNTGFTGTVRNNRVGLPKDFMHKKMDKGDVEFRRLKNTMVLRWVDKKDVNVLTTLHKPQMVNVKTRTSLKKKPTAIVDYNKYMGGVDHSDQMIAYNPFHRKTLKWWKKLFFHLLTLTLVQAHCLYQKVRKQIGKPGMQLDEFITSVGDDLLTIPNRRSKEVQPTPSGASVPQTPDHLRLQAKYDGHVLAPIKTRKNCVVCYKKLIKAGSDAKFRKANSKRTNYECKKCMKPLCVYPCMEIYHTVKDF